MKVSSISKPSASKFKKEKKTIEDLIDDSEEEIEKPVSVMDQLLSIKKDPPKKIVPQKSKLQRSITLNSVVSKANSLSGKSILKRKVSKKMVEKTIIQSGKKTQINEKKNT